MLRGALPKSRTNSQKSAREARRDKILIKIKKVDSRNPFLEKVFLFRSTGNGTWKIDLKKVFRKTIFLLPGGEVMMKGEILFPNALYSMARDLTGEQH